MARERSTFVALLAVTAVLWALLPTGCSQSSGLVRVTGIVKFPDGTVPQGEVAIIRFEPSLGSGLQTKAASDTIQPDGSFTLMTIKPGDGALPGDYKVVLSVRDKYVGGESLVHKDFTSASTTPLSAVVEAGKPCHFEFEVNKS